MGRKSLGPELEFITMSKNIDASNLTLEVEGYDFIKPLGEGGVSAVYLARHLGLDRLVAIKMLYGLDTNNEAQVARLQQEARITSNLDHPNIVRNFSSGINKGGQAFIAMEFLDGITLAEEFKNNGRMNLEKFRNVFIPLLNALDYAHKNGLVHRDIKPGNIMLCNDGNGGASVKLVDFGIAKILGGEGVSQQLTATGALIGSPSYMSPEQCVGKHVDARSDIYSIACVMYESLCGESLFQGNTALEVMSMHSTVSPPTVRDLSRKLDFTNEILSIMLVILAALSKDPVDRPQNAADFSRRLCKILDNTTLSKVPKMRKGGTSSRAIALCFIALISIMAAAAFILVPRLIKSANKEKIQEANVLESDLNPDTLIHRGKALQKRQLYEEAIHLYEQAIAKLKLKKVQKNALLTASSYATESAICLTLMKRADAQKWFDVADRYSGYVLNTAGGLEKSDDENKTRFYNACCLRDQVCALRKDDLVKIISVVEQSDKYFADDTWRMLDVRENAFLKFTEGDRLDLAEKIATEDLKLADRFGKDTYMFFRAQAHLSLLYSLQGKRAQGISLAKEVAETAIVSTHPSMFAHRRLTLLSSIIFIALRRLGQAEMMENLIALDLKVNPLDAERRPDCLAACWFRLGATYDDLYKFDEALGAYEKSWDFFKKNKTDMSNDTMYKPLLNRLILLSKKLKKTAHLDEYEHALLASEAKRNAE